MSLRVRSLNDGHASDRHAFVYLRPKLIRSLQYRIQRMALRLAFAQFRAASSLPVAAAPSLLLVRNKQTISRGIKDMLDEANAHIETLSTAQAIELHGKNDGSVVFVDLRDPRELEREGKMPGAVGCEGRGRHCGWARF